MGQSFFSPAIFFSLKNKKENRKIVELVMLEYILCTHTINRSSSLVLEIK